jgi:fatty acid synthase subunit beta
MRYLGRDSRAGEIAFDKERNNTSTLQIKLDSVTREHGDVYIEGIQPRFDPLKARHFDSSWNWHGRMHFLCTTILFMGS